MFDFWEGFRRQPRCVFELAAYLHSREDTKKGLVVCPVFAGPALLAANLGFSLLILMFVVCFPRADEFWPFGALFLGVLCFPCMMLLASVVLEAWLPSSCFQDSDFLGIHSLYNIAVDRGAEVTKEYCRSIDRIQHQVCNFTIDHAVSGCCAAAHVDKKTGQPVMRPGDYSQVPRPFWKTISKFSTFICRGLIRVGT